MVQLRFCVLLTALCACALGEFSSPPVVTIPVPNSETTKVIKDTIPVESVKTTSTEVDPSAPEPEPSQTPKPPTTQSPVTTSSTTSTTTPAPTTTTRPTTTTTPHTTTPPTTTPPTTTPPTTTTPTTTLPTTTPTTTPPTTTTTPRPEPTPAPAPVPVPTPEQGTWSYSDPKTNVTCVVVQFAAQLNVTYTQMVDNSTRLAYVVLNVPSTANVSAGSCGLEQLLSLSWAAPGSNVTSTMTLNYLKNDTTKSYALKNLTFELSPDLFVNASTKDAVVLSHGSDWRVPLAASYRCAEPTRMNLTAASGAVGALTLSKLQEEAFRTASGNGFNAARECGGGDVPDAVPIAVGCALGGLVVVVLVAYLVGRRRSAARGYVSM